MNNFFQRSDIDTYMTVNTGKYRVTLHLYQHATSGEPCRSFDKLDIKTALRFGKVVPSKERPNAYLHILELDECDYQGVMGNNGKQATHLIVVTCDDDRSYHKAISTAYFCNKENCGKIF